MTTMFVTKIFHLVSYILYLFCWSFVQETSISEKEWISQLCTTLTQLYNIYYEKVVCYSLRGIRCLILAKPEHLYKITHVQTSGVRTGIGSALGKYLKKCKCLYSSVNIYIIIIYLIPVLVCWNIMLEHVLVNFLYFEINNSNNAHFMIQLT